MDLKEITMATITEDYINFETAKLLKEKGFNEYCWKLYELRDSNKPVLLNGFDLDSESGFWNNKYLELYKKEHCHIKYNCSAPTLQMVMKWLREVHNLFIEIQCYGCEADEKAHFEYSYVISEYVKFNTGICTTFGLEERNAKSKFPSYEEACETAIKYCLENLIQNNYGED